MSHFTVLVIGQDPEKQLQPYHEFECTGTVDQYVLSIDKTQEARAGYDADTSKMIKVPAGVIIKPGTHDMVTHPIHGTLICRYSSFFQVENPEHDASAPFFDRKPEKIFKLPEGYKEIVLPTSEIESFSDWIKGYYGGKTIDADTVPDLNGEHQYGWIRIDAAGDVIEYIDRTNPNKKWDWYCLGGRWTGMLKMKPGVSGIVGRPGLMTEGCEPGYADAAFKADIDFEGMRQEAEKKAAEKFDAIRAIIEPHLPVIAWQDMLAKYRPTDGEPEVYGGVEAARQAYAAQPAVQALHAKYPFEDAEEYSGDRQTFIRHSGIRSAMTFAVVKDGKWYERGSMGWWGMVADEKDQSVWIEEFGKLVDGLPDDTLLSVYDCHI